MYISYLQVLTLCYSLYYNSIIKTDSDSDTGSLISFSYIILNLLVLTIPGNDR